MNSKIKSKIIRSKRVSIYHQILDLVATNGQTNTISFPGVTSSFNSTSTGTTNIPLYVACSNEQIVFKNNSDSFTVNINDGVQASFNYINDGNWYIVSNTQPSNSGLFSSNVNIVEPGNFSNGSSLSSSQYVQIGNFSVNGTHQSYTPVQGAIPYVIVNGKALVSWGDYTASLPQASIFSEATSKQFTTIQLSTDSQLTSLTKKYVEMLSSSSPSFNVFELINEITSLVNSQGVEIYDLNQISYYQENMVLTAGASSGFDTNSFSVAPTPCSFVLCRFSNSSTVPSDMQDPYAAISLVWNYSWDQTNNTNMLNYFSDSIGYMSLGVYSVNSTFSSTSSLTVASGVDSSMPFAPTWVLLNANPDQIWDYDPVLPNSQSLSIPSGSGLAADSIPSAFNSQPWANSGNTYWQSFGNSVNTTYAYVGYYFSGSATDVTIDPSNNAGQVLAAEGTMPLISNKVGSATYFYWSESDNQTGAGGIWAETSNTYSNYPNLYLQYYAIIPNSMLEGINLGNVNNWNISPNFTYSAQSVGTSNITVPILYINLANGSSEVSNLSTSSTNNNSELERMSKYYQQISQALESHLLTSHNAKLMFAGEVSSLVQTCSSINSISNPSNSSNSSSSSQVPFSTEQVFSLYSLMALTAVNNGSLTKFISTVVSGYPFSSIPSYINSLITLINNTYNLDIELTPTMFNSAISVFFSMESPTSVTGMISSNNLPGTDTTQVNKIKSTYTSSSGATYSIVNGLSIDSIQEIMFIISKGIALSDFSQAAANFISHIYSYITSNGTNPTPSQLDQLKQQWSQISQNWNKVGDTHTIDTESYCFIPSTNRVFGGLKQEFEDINQIVTSAFYFSATKSNISARLSQLMYNQHKTHSSLIIKFISYISEELLGFNDWSTLGDISLHLVLGTIDLGFSLLKFIGRLTERILSGVGSLTSPGSVIANIYSSTNKLLPDSMANFPNFNWTSNIITLDSNVKTVLSEIDLITFGIPNPKISVSQGTVVFSDESQVPIAVGKVNRFTLNTPVGEVYFWIDSQFGVNGQGLLQISDNTSIQSYGFDIPPETKLDGTVSELRTLRKLIDFVFNFPLMILPKSNSDTMSNMNISDIISNLYHVCSTVPGFSNLTSHISYGELAAVTGADAIAIAAYATAALNAGFDLDFTKAVGDGIIGAADAVAMAKFMYKFEEDEVANIADAFYLLNNTIKSYSSFINSLCSVDSNLANYNVTFKPYSEDDSTMSLFSWNYVPTTTVGEVCQLGNVIVKFSKFNQVSDLNLTNQSNIEGQDISINQYNPIYSTYSVSKLYIVEQAAVAVGKFALSNYVVNKLINKMKDHKEKVAQNDSKGSKLINKQLIETYAIKKYQRIKNGKSRMIALNNQTGTLSNDVQQAQNSLSNEIGSSMDDLVDGLSLIRGAN